MIKRRHRGSEFRQFLVKENLLSEVEAMALKRLKFCGPAKKSLSDFAGRFVYIGAMKNLFVFVAAAVIAGSLNVAAADKKAEKKEYPLKTCVVSDEKLGSMGKPYVIKHEGREVQFCCKSCEKDFKKEPAKYLKKIDEAAKKAK